MALTDGLDLIDPPAYEPAGPPHESWTELREKDPVHLCKPPGYGPFWAITRHADICRISKDPETFLSDPGIVMLDETRSKFREEDQGLGMMKTIIEMDPPEHRTFRKVASGWFTPNALSRVDAVVEKSARDTVDKLAGATGEGECDFAIEVATAHPLRVLCSILGVAQEDEPYILEMTNQLFGSDDPDLQRKGVDRAQAIRELGLEFYQFFAKIIEDRRANPRDDLASVLANGKVDGELMGPMETFGYYLITFTAGHDTTKNAIAGGMRALVDNPNELERVRVNPELVNPLFEEIVRWTTPVNYMKRTASRDVELAGKNIREGDEVVLFYASANRDDEIFEDPFSFRIDRDPNPHVGFGIGEHFCLGSNLARRSARALFRELTSRLEHVELAGEPEWIQSSFVVGLKHLPLRYRITPTS
ncbi:MAG: cytochrome P450 [Deltaproteobacteria bacterium]|nr:cytochrome P450 [Deltaproteobacteria bacterium]